MRSAVTLELKGHLNSAGFRPYLWHLATRAGLGGWISDCADGVLLHLEGDSDTILNFMKTFYKHLPNVFQIRSLRRRDQRDLSPSEPDRPFRLLGPLYRPEEVLPDRAPCPECTRRLLDPVSAFYHYPFLSCPECGPRFSVGLLAPFRRGTTTFRSFSPCRKCADAGYELQVCPECGPGAFLMDPSGNMLDSSHPVETASGLLAAGKILGVKLYDGFLLLCDARSAPAVQLLRSRKNRPDQPLSLIARDLSVVRKYCICSEEEEKLLSSGSAAVVLLRCRPDVPLNTSLLSPDDPSVLGISLSPTPMVRLLFERPGQSADLLACAGGAHPVDPEDAGGDEDFAVTARSADAMLIHDLRIRQNGGSSVLQVSGGKVRTLRRGRGLCPGPLTLPFSLKRNVLALGSDSAAAAALGSRNRIVTTQFLGDVHREEDARFLYLSGEQLSLIFARVPEMLVCDMDPESRIFQEASRISDRLQIPLATAQRHHANALACMAEHALTESLALVFDGGANGPDGTIWGAELLRVNGPVFQRFATFRPFEMTLPDSSRLKPGEVLAEFMEGSGVPVTQAWADTLNLPPEYFLTRNSSSSRIPTHAALALLDAVAALIGIAPRQVTYSGQILARFGRLLHTRIPETDVRRLAGLFPFEGSEKEDLLEIDWSPFFRTLSVPDRLQPYAPELLAAAFLEAFSSAALRMAEYGAAHTRLRTVVLSGKAFLCPRLEQAVREKLEKASFQVYTHHLSPPDESSVCIGQTVFGGLS